MLKWIVWNKMKPFNWVQKMSSGLFENIIYKMCSEIIYLIYMYKKDLALNDGHWLICYKTKPNQTKPNPLRSQMEL